MQNEIKILGIIPARKGSKGIPDKNIKVIAGFPLVAWTAQTLSQVSEVNKKICSTDSDAIAKICEKIGLEIPFSRPPELANDEALVKDTIRHAINFYENRGETFSHVLLLQATSPTVTIKDIKKAVKVGIETDADTVISCYKLENEHPSIMYYSGENFIKPVNSQLQSLRRQQQPSILVRTGLLYFLKVSSFIKSDSIIGEKIAYVEIEKDRSIDIDDIEDWERCENYLSGLHLC